jgi:hypothetical protein
MPAFTISAHTPYTSTEGTRGGHVRSAKAVGGGQVEYHADVREVGIGMAYGG